MIRTLLLVGCVGVGFALCTAANAQRREHSVISQPFRDLGFMRDEIPAALQTASEGPYAAPAQLADGRADCAAISTEIAALDGALGPDLNVRLPARAGVREGAGNLVRGAISSALKLPYRSVLRRLSGAERRDREMQDAMEAGMVRRAFLKGMQDSACNAVLPTQPQQTLADIEAPPVASLPESTPVRATRTPTPPATVEVAQPVAPAPAPTIQTVAAVEQVSLQQPARSE